MQFKKRYLILSFLGIIYLISHSSYFEFRTSDSDMKAQLSDQQQEGIEFFDYKVDGRNMHAVHVGADSLPLVLMIHGAPGSIDNMTGYLTDQRLTAKAQIVAVDRPGYGYSDYGKAEKSVERQAAAMLPILKKYLSPTNPKAVIAGHSFGGPVVARMAMDYPELIKGVAILAGSVAPELEPRDWYQKPLDWFFIRWLLPPAAKVCNQEIMPLYKELEKMLPLWKNIHCPVTMVHGTKDNLVPVGNVDFAKKMLVNSPLVVVDTLKDQNHFILWSHQDRIVDRIIELIGHE